MADQVKSTAEVVWRATLGELKLQMTKTMFNTWLKDAKLICEAQGEKGEIVYQIGVRNEYARDWLENRMADVINRNLSAIAGNPVRAVYVVWEEPASKAPPLPQLRTSLRVPPEPDFEVAPNAGALKVNGEDGYGGNLSSEARQVYLDRIAARERANGHVSNDEHTPEAVAGSLFSGFKPLESNFTQCPDQFFDEIIPKASGAVTKIVGVVIRQTIGTFLDKRNLHRRERWPCNNTILMNKAGLDSRTSVVVGLWDARAAGYIVLRELTDKEERRRLSKKHGYRCIYTLELRYVEDPVDHPKEPRPTYGSKEPDFE